MDIEEAIDNSSQTLFLALFINFNGRISHFLYGR